MAQLLIDKLQPGTQVTLGFAQRGKSSEEPAVFVKLTGEGESRHATFRQDDKNGNPYEWDAYRNNRRWVYGSSAQRLSLVSAGPLVDSA